VKNILELLKEEEELLDQHQHFDYRINVCDDEDEYLLQEWRENSRKLEKINKKIIKALKKDLKYREKN
jgi:hypothetical protein